MAEPQVIVVGADDDVLVFQGRVRAWQNADHVLSSLANFLQAHLQCYPGRWQVLRRRLFLPVNFFFQWLEGDTLGIEPFFNDAALYLSRDWPIAASPQAVTCREELFLFVAGVIEIY